jgi:hypothetical protein
MLAVTAPVARAADTQWTGATSGVWGDGSTWSAGVLPTSADNAQLWSGYPNTTITLSESNTANQLPVWAGASYTLTSSGLATLGLTDPLYVFSDPVASTLTISGSLAVSRPNGSIGTGANDDGGLLQVSGSSASVAISGTFNVGYDGTNNQLDANVGTLSADALAVGVLSTATDHTVLVRTAGAVTVSNALVGVAGSSNSLTVADGLITVTGDTELGTTATGSNNLIDIDGGTFTGTAGTLIVGRSGTGNGFVVENGGVATTGQARIGLTRPPMATWPWSTAPTRSGRPTAPSASGARATATR